jgi:hypothetical protein
MVSESRIYQHSRHTLEGGLGIDASSYSSHRLQSYCQLVSRAVLTLQLLRCAKRTVCGSEKIQGH